MNNNESNSDSMAKKTTKSTRKPRTSAQKSTNAKRTAKSSTKGGEAEKRPEMGLAQMGGDHETFATQKKKFRMLEALRHSLGIVTPAAEMAGINRVTHYRWMKDDPEYAKMVRDIEDIQFDFVETKLLENVKAGNVVAQIFYAKTKMKSRGYVERVEVEHIEKPAFVIDESNKGSKKIMDIVHNKNKKTGTND